jgi:hypothetical protein
MKRGKRVGETGVKRVVVRRDEGIQGNGRKGEDLYSCDLWLGGSERNNCVRGGITKFPKVGFGIVDSAETQIR